MSKGKKNRYLKKIICILLTVILLVQPQFTYVQGMGVETERGGANPVSQQKREGESEAIVGEEAGIQIGASQEVTTEASTSQEVTTEASTSQEVTTEASTSQEVTTEASTSQEVTTEASTSQEVTTEASTSQEVTTEASTSQEVTTEASTSQEVTTEASTSQEVTTEASTSQEVTTEASTSQEVTTEASTSQEVTTEASTSQEVTTEASTSQEVTTEASTSQEVTTEASTGQEETTETSTSQEITTEASTSQEEKTETEVLKHPSNGTLAGETLRFINLYWESDDLGEIEAVFDGGTGKEVVQRLAKKERGIYETTIPMGDYSRVAFRKAGSEEILKESRFNLYGNEEARVAEGPELTLVTSYQKNTRDTFYYDMGENPSYWGANPNYDSQSQPAERAKKAKARVSSANADSNAEPSTPGNPRPGDMIYFIDTDKVDGTDEDGRGKRVNIAFLKKGHPSDNPLGENGEYGVALTMYERRNGIYSVAFPSKVADYAEVAFQIVPHQGGESSINLGHHHNFRGDSEGAGSEEGLKWGYFLYETGMVDAFYLNRDQENSYWGAHPGLSDISLDTQVLYIDTTDLNGNNNVVEIDNLWIKWKNMPAEVKDGESGTARTYDAQKGYQITNTLAKENVRYFQFPYNSNATENTIFTLTYQVTNKEEMTEYKFTLVPRTGKNCLMTDNISQFNGQHWTTFEVGEIKERTLFFWNRKSGYSEILMRPAWLDEENQKHYITESNLTEFGWTEEDMKKYVVKVDQNGIQTIWLKMDSVPEPNDYEKENLYQLEIPAQFTHVQFRGTKAEKQYYSNLEQISENVSYPCYFDNWMGKDSQTVPEKEQENPGILGYWQSVYAVHNAGDASGDIPTGTFVKEEGTYYGISTFYDYYSSWEMTGQKIENNRNADNGEYGYTKQFTVFNQAADAYYKEKVGFPEDTKWADYEAIYCGSFPHPNSGSPVPDLWHVNTIKAGEDFSANNWTKENGGPKQGLVDATLKNGMVSNRGIELPQFNEEFLRGKNSLETAVGNVYKNVLFPFTRDTETASRTYGYWVFDSSTKKDAMRLTYDVDEGYFLDRTEDPITVRNRYSFLPFNNAETFRNININDNGQFAKINYLFGTHLNIDFKLTDNKEVYNEFTQKDEVIKFQFQGDDDAWIYVDGILALDMGGIHDAVRGEIDFKNNTYTIWRALGAGYNQDGIEAMSGSLPEELVTKLAEEDASHTLTMFYMERGLYESNLKLSFNFPRQSTFSVEKELDLTSKATPGEENIFFNLLENMGGFSFGIKNLVTSGTTLKVEESSGYMQPGQSVIVYNESNEAEFAFSGEEAGTVEGVPGGTRTITQKAIVGGNRPDESNLLKITPSSSINVLNMSYLRMAMQNNGPVKGANHLYLSFVDTNGKRVGGYANTLGFEDEINSFTTGEDLVLRIDHRKMTGDSDFHWGSVAYLLVGVRNTSTEPNPSTTYQISSLTFFESLNQRPMNGFAVTNDRISDYGSYESGMLTPVEGAWYTKQNKIGENVYDAGTSRVTDEGRISLANGQKAVFRDKFRVGSYIDLTEENIDSKVFETSWSIFEDGQPIEAQYLLKDRIDVFSVQNPLDLITSGEEFPLQDVMRQENEDTVTVGDGRREVIDSNWVKPANFQEPDLMRTIVYRSYKDPDNSSNVSIDLGVKVKNTIKYGSVTIQKQLEEGMKKEDGTFEPGDYSFEIYFTDIAGMGLESQLAPDGELRYLKQTVTVHVDTSGTGSITMDNIPAGTKYWIREKPSNGAVATKIQIGENTTNEAIGRMEPHTELKVVGTGEKGDVVDPNAHVEGIAYASDQEFVFTNRNDPFYMDIEKVWKDGLTDEQRENQLGITEVRIQLQRCTLDAQGKPNGEWVNVTKDFFENSIGYQDNVIALSKEGGWKTTSSTILPYKDKETGVRYEYRIQELDYQNILRHYAVEYNEIPNENKEVDGKKYPHVTYQAINAPAGISLQKRWEDGSDISQVRPEKIRVRLVGSSDWNPDSPEVEGTWNCYKKILEPEHQCEEGNCWIELSEGRSWSAALSSVPLTDSEERKYYYKLAEEQVFEKEINDEGQWISKWVPVEESLNQYAVTYGTPVHPGDGGEAGTVLFATNTMPMGNITILKKESGTNTVLKDARFKLQRLIPREGVSDEELSVDPNFVREATTSATGTIEFTDLPYGKYRITEVRAPGGYILLKQPVHVTLSEEAFQEQAEQHKDDPEYDPSKKTITVTIFNEKSLTMPTTGGWGSIWFTIAGILLMGAAMLLYIGRKGTLHCVRERKLKRKERK